jgi:hypothetical protein
LQKGGCGSIHLRVDKVANRREHCTLRAAPEKSTVCSSITAPGEQP